MKSFDPPGPARVLILAPTTKDAQATAHILASAALKPVICEDLAQICAEMSIGADAAILTEEAILSDRSHMLRDILARQPVWSDFPVIVLTRAGRELDSVNRALESIGNMTLINRPVYISTLLSHIRAALRDRHRQYALRDRLTDQARQAMALTEANKYFELMLESASDFAIVSLEVDGTIVRWTDGAKRIFGYEPEEVIGQPVDIIFTPEDRAAEVSLRELTQAAAQGRAPDERWHMRKDGARFYASGTMAAMYDDGGQVRGFVKIARDMTDQKQAEEMLIAARNASEAANIAKTEFLANMSHEIRTPMNAVVGLSTLLSTSKPLTQKQKEYVRTLRTSADQLLALINDLLDIAKIEAQSVEVEHTPFSLSRVTQEVISIVSTRAREKGLKLIETNESHADRMHLGDPTRIRQILLNLCSNAVKFTETGTVTIAIDCQPAASPKTENISISVTDTGIGIPPAKLATIFDKFTQADSSINRKYGGTGLGLAITKTLTEIMGGELSVESALGQGSTFKVSITLEIASEQQVQNIDESLSVSHEPGSDREQVRILLVEDYEANILVASTFIESFGYLVDVATNGVEAVDKARTGTYAAALMDVQMPGMNGFEATLYIREFERKTGRPNLPIIGMTAHALAGDQERCLAAGMDGYISKPFNPNELESLLRKHTGKAA